MSVNLKSCFPDWLEMFWSRRGWIVWISVDTYFIVILYNKVPLFLCFLFKTPIRLQTKHFTQYEYEFERITLGLLHIFDSTSSSSPPLWNVSGRSRDLAEALAATQKD